jgi:hypothetical protein
VSERNERIFQYFQGGTLKPLHREFHLSPRLSTIWRMFRFLSLQDSFNPRDNARYRIKTAGLNDLKGPVQRPAQGGTR